MQYLYTFGTGNARFFIFSQNPYSLKKFYLFPYYCVSMDILSLLNNFSLLKKIIKKTAKNWQIFFFIHIKLFKSHKRINFAVLIEMKMNFKLRKQLEPIPTKGQIRWNTITIGIPNFDATFLEIDSGIKKVTILSRIKHI